MSPAPGVPPLVAGDFTRALATRPRARTEHFSLHHLSPPPMPVAGELSTSDVCRPTRPVDECLRLGQTVPKRYARRAVSRNLIRRQALAAFERHSKVLPRGDWFIRLRAPFAPAQFPSAASPALKRAVNSELDTLFAAAVA